MADLAQDDAKWPCYDASCAVVHGDKVRYDVLAVLSGQPILRESQRSPEIAVH